MQHVSSAWAIEAGFAETGDLYFYNNKVVLIVDKQNLTSKQPYFCSILIVIANLNDELSVRCQDYVFTTDPVAWFENKPIVFFAANML